LGVVGTWGVVADAGMEVPLEAGHSVAGGLEEDPFDLVGDLRSSVGASLAGDVGDAEAAVAAPCVVDSS